jgi:uncharacterized protein (DUF1499 family)
VSTQAPPIDPLRRIEPLRFAVPAPVAMAAVLRVLARLPRMRVLERDDVSVHAVTRSAWLRVPTDLELRIDDTAGLVHLRVGTLLALRERARSRTRALELLHLIERELRAT